MRSVVVEAFGGVEHLKLVEEPTPSPGPGQVLVRLTSIGMNHAELMQRQGAYRLTSGDPPFTPGLEGGGVIEAVGDGVRDRHVGQRVILALKSPRSPEGMGGTYRTHYLCDAALTVAAPEAIADEQLGAIWLPYLTAWGCLVWQHGIREGDIVALPAASSSVALAAAQIARHHGCTTIGLTTRQDKVDAIRALPGCAYDHLLVTRGPDGGDLPWHRQMRTLTQDHPRGGVDVFFDPVAAGQYLDTEIRCLAQGGTIWIYGLLGEPGQVDVTPLIRKQAAIRGWVNGMLIDGQDDALQRGYREVLAGFEQGVYRQQPGGTFALDDVQQAHTTMEQGRHIGKLILLP